MSEISLTNDIAVDPAEIESARLDEKGAKISSKVVSVASGDWQDLEVPEDSLIVRMKDGSEFVVRGENEAKQAWTVLGKAKSDGKLAFELNTNKRAG